MREQNDSILIDAINSAGQPHKTLPRIEVLTRGLDFRVVHVFLYFDGKIILQKLSRNHKRNISKLGSSAAGFLLSGESTKQAAHRVLKKELGLVLPDLNHVRDLSMVDGKSKKLISLYTYEINSIPSPDPDQISSLILMHPDDILRKIKNDPAKFTETFRVIYNDYRK